MDEKFRFDGLDVLPLEEQLQRLHNIACSGDKDDKQQCIKIIRGHIKENTDLCRQENDPQILAACRKKLQCIAAQSTFLPDQLRLQLNMTILDFGTRILGNKKAKGMTKDESNFIVDIEYCLDKIKWNINSPEFYEVLDIIKNVESRLAKFPQNNLRKIINEKKKELINRIDQLCALEIKKHSPDFVLIETKISQMAETFGQKSQIRALAQKVEAAKKKMLEDAEEQRQKILRRQKINELQNIFTNMDIGLFETWKNQNNRIFDFESDPKGRDAFYQLQKVADETNSFIKKFDKAGNVSQEVETLETFLQGRLFSDYNQLQQESILRFAENQIKISGLTYLIESWIGGNLDPGSVDQDPSSLIKRYEKLISVNSLVTLMDLDRIENTLKKLKKAYFGAIEDQLHDALNSSEGIMKIADLLKNNPEACEIIGQGSCYSVLSDFLEKMAKGLVPELIEAFQCKGKSKDIEGLRTILVSQSRKNTAISEIVKALDLIINYPNDSENAMLTLEDTTFLHSALAAGRKALWRRYAEKWLKEEILDGSLASASAFLEKHPDFDEIIRLKSKVESLMAPVSQRELLTHLFKIKNIVEEIRCNNLDLGSTLFATVKNKITFFITSWEQEELKEMHAGDIFKHNQLISDAKKLTDEREFWDEFNNIVLEALKNTDLHTKLVRFYNLLDKGQISQVGSLLKSIELPDKTNDIELIRAYMKLWIEEIKTLSTITAKDSEIAFVIINFPQIAIELGLQPAVCHLFLENRKFATLKQILRNVDQIILEKALSKRLLLVNYAVMDRWDKAKIIISENPLEKNHFHIDMVAYLRDLEKSGKQVDVIKAFYELKDSIDINFRELSIMKNNLEKAREALPLWNFQFENGLNFHDIEKIPDDLEKLNETKKTINEFHILFKDPKIFDPYYVSKFEKNIFEFNELHDAIIWVYLELKKIETSKSFNRLKSVSDRFNLMSQKHVRHGVIVALKEHIKQFCREYDTKEEIVKTWKNLNSRKFSNIHEGRQKFRNFQKSMDKYLNQNSEDKFDISTGLGLECSYDELSWQIDQLDKKAEDFIAFLQEIMNNVDPIVKCSRDKRIEVLPDHIRNYMKKYTRYITGSMAHLEWGDEYICSLFLKKFNTHDDSLKEKIKQCVLLLSNDEG